MPVILKNNAFSTLATAITASDTAIVVADGSQFPALSAGEYFYVTLVSPAGTTEIVKVTARVSNSLTVVRAQDGSSAASFQVGALVEMRANAASVTDLVDEHDQAAEISIADAGGYYTATDVEGALQEAAQASTTKYTPPGTGAVTRTVQSRLRDFVSVKDFGAVGDGVTDDATALQAALDYAVSEGVELYFPAGSYLTDTELTTSGVLRVRGAPASIVASSAMTAVFTHSSNANLYMDGLYFDANSLATYAFRNTGGINQGSHISRCRFGNATNADWYCAGYIYNLHADQVIMSGGQYGFYVSNAGTLTNGARFTNLRVSNTSVFAVYLENTASSRASISFANPTLEGNNGGGFYIKNHNTLLDMPYFESNGKVSGDPDIMIETANFVVTTVKANMPIWGPAGAAQTKTINASTGPVRVTLESTHCQFAHFLPSSNSFIINGNNFATGSRMFFFSLGTPTIENYPAGNVLETSFV